MVGGRSQFTRHGAHSAPSATPAPSAATPTTATESTPAPVEAAAASPRIGHPTPFVTALGGLPRLTIAVEPGTIARTQAAGALTPISILTRALARAVDVARGRLCLPATG